MAGCMTSLFLQHDGKLDVRSLSFGARDLRPFAAMGLAKGVITSKPEEYLHKYTGYANMCRGSYPSASAIPLYQLAIHNRMILMMILFTGPKAVQPKPAKMILKAPLVPRTQRPVMGLHSDKDCVYANALQTIR